MISQKRTSGNQLRFRWSMTIILLDMDFRGGSHGEVMPLGNSWWLVSCEKPDASCKANYLVFIMGIASGISWNVCMSMSIYIYIRNIWIWICIYRHICKHMYTYMYMYIYMCDIYIYIYIIMGISQKWNIMEIGKTMEYHRHPTHHASLVVACSSSNGMILVPHGAPTYSTSRCKYPSN